MRKVKYGGGVWTIKQKQMKPNNAQNENAMRKRRLAAAAALLVLAGGALLWHYTTAPKPTLIRHPNGISAFAFSPDSKTLATGSNGITFWNAETGALLKTIEVYDSGSLEFCSSLAYSPDGKTLAAAAGPCWEDSAIYLIHR